MKSYRRIFQEARIRNIFEIKDRHDFLYFLRNKFTTICVSSQFIKSVLAQFQIPGYEAELEEIKKHENRAINAIEAEIKEIGHHINYPIMVSLLEVPDDKKQIASIHEDMWYDYIASSLDNLISIRDSVEIGIMPVLQHVGFFDLSQRLHRVDKPLFQAVNGKNFAFKKKELKKSLESYKSSYKEEVSQKSIYEDILSDAKNDRSKFYMMSTIVSYLHDGEDRSKVKQKYQEFYKKISLLEKLIHDDLLKTLSLCVELSSVVVYPVDESIFKKQFIIFKKSINLEKDRYDKTIEALLNSTYLLQFDRYKRVLTSMSLDLYENYRRMLQFCDLDTDEMLIDKLMTNVRELAHLVEASLDTGTFSDKKRELKKSLESYKRIFKEQTTVRISDSTSLQNYFDLSNRTSWFLSPSSQFLHMVQNYFDSINIQFIPIIKALDKLDSRLKSYVGSYLHRPPDPTKYKQLIDIIDYPVIFVKDANVVNSFVTLESFTNGQIQITPAMLSDTSTLQKYFMSSWHNFRYFMYQTRYDAIFEYNDKKRIDYTIMDFYKEYDELFNQFLEIISRTQENFAAKKNRLKKSLEERH